MRQVVALATAASHATFYRPDLMNELAAALLVSGLRAYALAPRATAGGRSLVSAVHVRAAGLGPMLCMRGAPSQSHVDEMRTVDISNVLWAYANLHAYHPGLFKVQTPFAEMRPDDLAKAAAGAAAPRCSVRCETRAQTRVAHMLPLATCTLRAMVPARVRARRALGPQAVLRRTAVKLEQGALSRPHACSVLWACAVVQHPGELDTQRRMYEYVWAGDPAELEEAQRNQVRRARSPPSFVGHPPGTAAGCLQAGDAGPGSPKSAPLGPALRFSNQRRRRACRRRTQVYFAYLIHALSAQQQEALQMERLRQTVSQAARRRGGGGERGGRAASASGNGGGGGGGGPREDQGVDEATAREVMLRTLRDGAEGGGGAVAAAVDAGVVAGRPGVGLDAEVFWPPPIPREQQAAYVESFQDMRKVTTRSVFQGEVFEQLQVRFWGRGWGFRAKGTHGLVGTELRHESRSARTHAAPRRPASPKP